MQLRMCPNKDLLKLLATSQTSPNISYLLVFNAHHFFNFSNAFKRNMSFKIWFWKMRNATSALISVFVNWVYYTFRSLICNPLEFFLIYNQRYSHIQWNNDTLKQIQQKTIKMFLIKLQNNKKWFLRVQRIT